MAEYAARWQSASSRAMHRGAMREHADRQDRQESLVETADQLLALGPAQTLWRHPCTWSVLLLEA